MGAARVHAHRIVRHIRIEHHALENRKLVGLVEIHLLGLTVFHCHKSLPCPSARQAECRSPQLLDFIAHSRGLFELEIARQFGHFNFELLDALHRLLRRQRRNIAADP